MKRNRWFLVVVLALLAVGTWYAFQPSHTPGSQPPLVTLNSANFSVSFYSALNRYSRDTRLVLLLSPT